MKVSAVLFDYDGVTADSPRLNHIAWAHAFARFDVRIEQEDYFQLEGHGPRKIAEILCSKHGIELALSEALVSAKETYMQGLGQPAIYPEIPELLAVLWSRGIRLALVTGASRSRINASLPTELRGYYSTIVTSDDTKRTKPDPEPYLKASIALGGTGSEMIVIENAPLGIRSAKAAEMFCVALTTTLPAQKLEEADRVFMNHGDLASWLVTITDSDD